MCKTTWGKVGEKLLKKVQKITQMFQKTVPQFFIDKSAKTLDFTKIHKRVNPDS